MNSLSPAMDGPGPPVGAEAEGRTVLIVEDFGETRFMIKLALELSGYRVVEARDGREGVEVAMKERPDVILMDLSLPRMDGFMATRLIREAPEVAGVPVVAISAHATPEYRVKAFASGCNEYLTKPIDLDRLRGVVANLLKTSAEARSAAR